MPRSVNQIYPLLEEKRDRWKFIGRASASVSGSLFDWLGVRSARGALSRSR